MHVFIKKKVPPDIRLKIQHCLQDIWVQFAEHLSQEEGTPSSVHTRKIYDLIGYLHEHYTEKFSLTALAETVFMSRNECCRYFKQAMNMTITEYLLEYRLSQGRRASGNIRTQHYANCRADRFFRCQLFHKNVPAKDGDYAQSLCPKSVRTQCIRTTQTACMNEDQPIASAPITYQALKKADTGSFDFPHPALGLCKITSDCYQTSAGDRFLLNRKPQLTIARGVEIFIPLFPIPVDHTDFRSIAKLVPGGR